jgi:hypothetical protein
MNAVVEKASNPFGSVAAVASPGGASAGALMAREAQDILVQMMAARNNPRDVVRATDRILNAFTRPALCEDALYAYSRGGQDISGLSIRAAEVLAQQWGNIRTGIAELSRMNGQSEFLAYAQDLETGFSDEKRFFVKHWRDTKQGGYLLTDERDIYEVGANNGARRKRACILAVIPSDVQDAARDQIDLTLHAKAEVTPESIKNLLDKFATFKVTKEMIEKRIQRRLDAMLPAQLIQMRRVFISLRDGMSEPSQWFDDFTAPESGATDDDKPKPANKTEALKEQLKAKGAGKSDPKEPATVTMTEAEAIASLKEAGSDDDLKKAWTKIKAAFTGAPDGVPVDIEAVHHDRLEYFRGLAEKKI